MNPQPLMNEAQIGPQCSQQFPGRRHSPLPQPPDLCHGKFQNMPLCTPHQESCSLNHSCRMMHLPDFRWLRRPLSQVRSLPERRQAEILRPQRKSRDPPGTCHPGLRALPSQERLRHPHHPSGRFLHPGVRRADPESRKATRRRFLMR